MTNYQAASVREVMRRLDRSSLGFQEDTNWLLNNTDTVYECIDDLRRKVDSYFDGEEM